MVRIVVLTFTRMIKSLVTRQTPDTLEAGVEKYPREEIKQTQRGTMVPRILWLKQKP